jgi:gluconolactonase
MADTKRFLTAADVDTAGLASFRSHHGDFDALLGRHPTVTLLVQDGGGAPTFHEACIYHAASHSVFVTSNQITVPPGEPGHANAATAGKRVTVSRVYDAAADAGQVVRCEDATPADHADGMWNGGVNYGGGGLLYCAQGSRTNAGGLVHVADPVPPYRSRTLVSGFHGRPFNSVNDVVVDPRDGAVWFTDPSYGYHQGIRPAPRLPGHVYRFEPEGGHIRAVADGFVRPNGLCFAPDLAVLYVTDTGAVHGSPSVPVDPAGPSHIYAFDVVVRPGPFLANRRLFAFADGGCPDGIKCDTRGNVYAGCGDGVEVWNPAGTLIGRILVQGGVANFCFGRNGAIYMCNETRLWKAQMAEHVRGALLGI